MSIIPTGSDSYRKRNPHLFAPFAEMEKEPVKKRIRQDPKPLLNQLETQWLQQMRQSHPLLLLHAQAIRFRLGNGIWYKPDAVCISTLEVWEVKGPFAHRGGFENLKVAAHQYPEFRFYLVWREKGLWNTQLILP